MDLQSVLPYLRSSTVMEEMEGSSRREHPGWAFPPVGRVHGSSTEQAQNYRLYWSTSKHVRATNHKNMR